MELQPIYESMELVPEGFKESYTELENGSVRLNIEGGFKTPSEIEALASTMRKERDERKALQKQLKEYESIDLNSYKENMSLLEELKQKQEQISKQKSEMENTDMVEETSEPKNPKKEGKLEDNKPAIDMDIIQKYVDAAVEKTAKQAEEKHNALLEALEKTTKQAEDYQTRLRDKSFSDIVIAAATKHGVDTSDPNIAKLVQQFTKEKGFRVDDNGENIIALDGDNNPIFSKEDPTKPLGLDEYFSGEYADTYKFTLKKSKGAGSSSGKEAGKAPTKNYQYIDDFKSISERAAFIKENPAKYSEIVRNGKRPANSASGLTFTDGNGNPINVKIG